MIDTRPMQPALTLFQGRAADRTSNAVKGSHRLARSLGDYLAMTPVSVGTPRRPLNAQWDAELESALPELRQLADTLADHVEKGRFPITILPLCTGALATLPVIARCHPDACLVWLDAHGDLNVPGNSESGYLGGMVVAAATGEWESGLGNGWSLEQVILVDGRDLDQAEQQLINQGGVKHLTSKMLTPEALSKAIGNRPVYVHLDCDVLSPGILPTDYSVRGGLNLPQLHDLCAVIGNHALIGFEVAELEENPDYMMSEVVKTLCNALSPLYKRFIP